MKDTLMVTRASFIKDKEVQSFIYWLAQQAPILAVHLDIPRSRRVPNGINCRVNGLEQVVRNYQWKATAEVSPGVECGSQDWESTRNCLSRLSTRLRNALADGNRPGTLSACHAVLQWGGDVNPKVGTRPFLQSLPNIVTYLNTTRNTLQLAKADLTGLGGIRRMNSMLTKVHALASTDGLPIYDTRVAVAIASLVELYRRSTNKSWTVVPDLLKFPAAGNARSGKSRDVAKLFPRALSHGSVANRRPVLDTIPWTQAKVRLGWIMDAVLNRNKELFRSADTGGHKLVDRMHAFEAAMFMIGYDAQCLQMPGIGVSPVAAVSARSVVTTPRKRAEHTDTIGAAKTGRTLQRGNRFAYWVTLAGDYVVQISRSQRVTLPSDFVDLIVKTFSLSDWIAGGFNRTGNAQGTFADYVVDEGSAANVGTLSRQHASRIAAVLVAEKRCEFKLEGRAVFLRFPAS